MNIKTTVATMSILSALSFGVLQQILLMRIKRLSCNLWEQLPSVALMAHHLTSARPYLIKQIPWVRKRIK